jgi:GrpB-like predicted nucleotidyltransferase (UPF0157 family)
VVVVVPYTPEWRTAFHEVRARLLTALSNLPVEIEHVGSTSVVGLPAKPILDIDVVLESEDDVPRAVAALAAAGYQHRGDRGVPGREAFTASGTTDLEEHVYVVVRGSKPHRDHIDFRDYLHAHPETAAEHAALKAELAGRFPTDGPDDQAGYTEAKTDFIEAVLADARRGN